MMAYRYAETCGSFENAVAIEGLLVYLFLHASEWGVSFLGEPTQPNFNGDTKVNGPIGSAPYTTMTCEALK